MLTATHELPRRGSRLSLKSGLYLIEYLDQNDGSIAAQARGPLPTASIAPRLGARVGGPAVVARAPGRSDSAALDALLRKLRTMGELP